MDDLNGKLFQTFHMFHKLNFSELLPNGISRNDFSTLMCIRYGGKGRGPHGHCEEGKKEVENFNQKISISAIAKALYVTTPAVSRTLKSLEEKGLIQRETDAKDKRNTFVSLTEKGKQFLQRADYEMNDYLSTVVQNMKKEDMEKLVDYLQRYFEISKNELERRKRLKIKKDREES